MADKAALAAYRRQQELLSRMRPLAAAPAGQQVRNTENLARNCAAIREADVALALEEQERKARVRAAMLASDADLIRKAKRRRLV